MLLRHVQPPAETPETPPASKMSNKSHEQQALEERPRAVRTDSGEAAERLRQVAAAAATGSPNRLRQAAEAAGVPASLHLRVVSTSCPPTIHLVDMDEEIEEAKEP